MNLSSTARMIMFLATFLTVRYKLYSCFCWLKSRTVSTAVNGRAPRMACAWSLLVVAVMLAAGFGAVGPGSVGTMYGPPFMVSNSSSVVTMAKCPRSVVEESIAIMLASSFCWKVLMVVNVGGSVSFDNRGISLGW